MWKLALSSVHAFRASLAGTFVVLALAGALLAGMGVLVESGLRGGVLPDRYAGTDVVVTSARVDAPVTSREAAAVQRVDGVARAAAESTVALTTASGTTVDASDWPATALSTTAHLASGHAPRAAGEVVLDRSLAAAARTRVGGRVRLAHGGVPGTYTVVGLLDRTARASRPAGAYLTGADMHRLVPATRSASDVVAVRAARGTSPGDLARRIQRAVPGVSALTGDARGRAEFPDARAADSGLLELTASLSGTAGIIVVFVVASTTGLSVRARRRQFALLRAVGATAGQLRGMVVREVLLVSAVAAPLGAVPGLYLGHLLRGPLVTAGAIPADYSLVVSPLPVLGALVVLAPVALLAGLVTARQVTRIAPAEAMRRSAVESARLGRGRRTTALVVGAVGTGAAFTPLFVPGPLGAASAGSAALVLLVGAAIGGPVLVTAATRWLGAVLGRWRSFAPTLAVANARTSSRRLTAVVVPLAMTLSLGMVQISVNGLLARSSAEHLRSALRADLVVTGAGGIAPGLVQQVSGSPGVTAAATMSSADVTLTTTGGDAETSSGTAVALPADPPRSVLALHATSGSLAGLAHPGTVALSEDTAAEETVGVGGVVHVRHGARDRALRVVAVYDADGLGDAIVAPPTLRSLTRGSVAVAGSSDAGMADAVLVATSPGRAAAVRARAHHLGLSAVSTSTFLAERSGATARDQHLSALLMLALLAFVLLAAGSTLVMATAERSGEFALLRTVGASRGQLLATALAESVIVATAAIALGTLTLLPAFAGVLASLHLTSVPASTWVTHGALDATVLAVAVVGLVGTTAVVTRRPRAQRA